MHSKAAAAHAAAEAAHRQNKFWEMHDKIFESQREMSPQKYQEYAAEIGLDVEKFNADLDSDAVKKRIDADKAQAAASARARAGRWRSTAARGPTPGWQAVTTSPPTTSARWSTTVSATASC